VNPDDADSRDFVLAAERTDLAWDRSGLALLAVGVFVLRGIARPPLDHRDAVVGACVIALAALTMFTGWWHAHLMRTRGSRPTSIADLLPISGCVALIGVAAFVLGVLSPS
jgi:uncharacterized membrane protein YidH (DUF202 family)